MMLKTSGDAMLVRPTTRAEKIALRRRVQAGELVEPFPCMFERADAWEQLLPDQRMRRILSTLGASRPDIVFCSYSAAVMHRLPVSYRLLSRVHVAAGTKEASHNSHHIARHRMARVPSVEVDGVRVTPLVDTVIDCLITASLGDGLAIADAFLRQLDIERELLVDLVAVLGAARRGVARALYTASWADGRSESGGESIARGVMIEEGIVPADLQVSFIDPVDRESTMRGDYFFRLLDGTQVLGELDGKEKYVNKNMTGGKPLSNILLEERKRESHLTMLGMPVVRFTMEDVWKKGRVKQLLAAAGVRPDTIAADTYLATAKKPPTENPYVAPAVAPEDIEFRLRRALRKGIISGPLL